jgi:release factor glutamine methyltransferase
MGSDEPGPPVTLAQALATARERLAAAGIDSAAGDARRLAALALGETAAGLIRDGARPLSAAQQDAITDLIARRANREPVSRIEGRREFYGRPFMITPAVLDPRADTETLIGVALDLAGANGWRERPVRILDLGTGSGAILLTLLAELPMATGTGVDISAAALACAAANAHVLGLEDRGTFVLGDMGACEAGGYELVVSNPPYIPAGDIADLDPEVAKFDPVLALSGGADGLAFYRAIFARLALAQDVSVSQQWAVIEAGAGQSGQIIEIARQAGVDTHGGRTILRRDLGGHTRCVAICTRPPLAEEKALEPR